MQNMEMETWKRNMETEGHDKEPIQTINGNGKYGNGNRPKQSKQNKFQKRERILEMEIRK